MKKALIFSLMTVFILLTAVNAFSQLYAGGYIGYSAQKPDFSNVTLNTDTTFLYGLHVGIKLWMLAAELNFFKAAHNIDVSDIWHPGFDQATLDYTYLGLNIRYMFTLFFLRPYLTAGYGYYTADIHNIDKDKEGGYNAGVGVEIKLGKKITVLVEGKYHHVTLDIEHVNFSLGNFTLCGGVNYYF